jgi:hypothetical protein
MPAANGGEQMPAAECGEQFTHAASLASTSLRASAAPTSALLPAAECRARMPAADSGEPRDPASPDADAEPAPRAFSLGTTDVVAPLLGSMYTPAPGQSAIGFYASDLGRSTVHEGMLRFMFGDSWADARATAIDPDWDDVQGEISLRDFPNGAAVDAYVAAHPAPSGGPPWRASAPPLTLLTRNGQVAPVQPVRDGVALGLGIGRTPVASWSDGGEGLFGIFDRFQPLACTTSEPRCPKDFTCDEGLGNALGVDREAMPCLIGSDATCAAIPGGGYCIDPTSSTHRAGDPTARILSVVYIEELGNEDLTQPGRFLTTALYTNKFINPCARTVADFDPQRRGHGDSYAPADGHGAHETLFLWGRPWYSGARGRDVRLYFQALDLPHYDAAGHFDLTPQFFAGMNGDAPQFSPRELDARALDLSYEGGDPSTEQYDEPGELSITWIEPLQRWVMLFGGHYPPLAQLLMQGSTEAANELTPDPEGAIKLRVAEHPWGPWSKPQTLLRAQTVSGVIAALPSAPKGIVARPDCTAADCPPHEPSFAASELGALYSAHVIEPWTTERDDGVELYWVVSTWNPYQVVLMKTKLSWTR